MSNNPRSGGSRRLVKPTLDTEFHIDYDWWERQDLDLRTYLISLLPEDHRTLFQSGAEDVKIDWIDPETAEVRQVDPLQRALQERDEVDYSQMPLVDAVFRVFLANNNAPLTPNELAQIVTRPAKTILRTLSGARVYRGLRPVIEE